MINPAASEHRFSALANDFVERHRLVQKLSIESYAAACPDLGDEIVSAFPAAARLRGAAESRTAKGGRNMHRVGLDDKQRNRLFAAILGASLLAGCEPGGTGSITVDGKDPAVRGFKTLEDVKTPKPGKTGKKLGGTKSVPRAGFQ